MHGGAHAIQFVTRVMALFLLASAFRLCLAETPMDQARKDYREGRYGQALSKFKHSAAQGDSSAQEIIGFMYLHGAALYGAEVAQDRDQAIYWFERAAHGGREVAQHMLCVLRGRPANTVVDRAGCTTVSAKGTNLSLSAPPRSIR